MSSFGVSKCSIWCGLIFILYLTEKYTSPIKQILCLSCVCEYACININHTCKHIHVSGTGWHGKDTFKVSLIFVNEDLKVWFIYRRKMIDSSSWYTVHKSDDTHHRVLEYGGHCDERRSLRVWLMSNLNTKTGGGEKSA